MDHGVILSGIVNAATNASSEMKWNGEIGTEVPESAVSESDDATFERDFSNAFPAESSRLSLPSVASARRRHVSRFDLVTTALPLLSVWYTVHPMKSFPKGTFAHFALPKVIARTSSAPSEFWKTERRLAVLGVSSASHPSVRTTARAVGLAGGFPLFANRSPSALPTVRKSVQTEFE